MIHPDTELRWIDDEVGYGTVATALIPRGTIIWALDPLDRIFTPEAIDALPEGFSELLLRFTYADAAGNRVLLWDGARHMNHSCAPNCAGTLAGFEVALRDILPGEELTNDYGTFGQVDEDFPCRCGAPACRGGYGRPMSAEAATALQHAYASALAEVPTRPQPLGHLVGPALLSRPLGQPAAP